jgi:hypothetical protein
MVIAIAAIPLPTGGFPEQAQLHQLLDELVCRHERTTQAHLLQWPSKNREKSRVFEGLAPL